MEIRTPRLLLRDFVESDVPSVWGYQSDPRYLQHTPWKTRTENEAREFVLMLIGWANDEPRTKYQLAIVREGSVIGSCGIRLVSNEDHEAEFGCEIDPRVWGNGYAKEAGGAMLEFAFRTLRIHRVFSETVSENEAAIAIGEKLGMKREGCLRERQRIGERWLDTVVLGILENEWSPGLAEAAPGR